jgi:L-threonylcarbamoyladenylate synthase
MQIPQAIKELEQGNVVAIPTETVYGLAADATNEQAIKKIFALKNRPSDNPLIVHVGSTSAIEKYALIQSPIEQKIIDTLMPGPITILLHKKDIIPRIVTADSALVAIRVPQHPIALEILQQSGLALAAPSANISWSPSPTTAAMVRKNFGDDFNVVDGGPCLVWIESTVVQVQDNTVLIHRPGFITPDDIASVVWPTVQVIYSNTETNISPGIKYKHYSPKARIHILCAGDPLPPNSAKTWLLVTDEWIQSNKCDTEQCIYRTYRWGSHTNLLECAQNLYSSYHQADIDAISDLYVEALPETNGVGYAIMNRIKKSSQ